MNNQARIVPVGNLEALVASVKILTKFGRVEDNIEKIIGLTGVSSDDDYKIKAVSPLGTA